MSGKVSVTTTDETQQEVVMDEPTHGVFFGFASMLQRTPHQTTGHGGGRDDLPRGGPRRYCRVAQVQGPDAGMDMLTVQARQFHASQKLVQNPRQPQPPTKSLKNGPPSASASRTRWRASAVSWTFIILFGIVLVAYSGIEHGAQESRLGSVSLHPPEPLPVDAGRDSGSGHHDEPEPSGHQRPGCAASWISM